MKQSLPLYLLLVIIIFTNCAKKNTTQKETYFGGEIINPRSKYVVLYKDNQLIDSIALDVNNKFTYQFKNFKAGLYTFSHDEYQYLYLEPTDSLFLRLNTIDFDETLTFSGKGADKNNLLIRTFLTNEQDIKETHQLFSLPPKHFIQKTNDRLNRRRTALERYASKYEFSEDFKAIADTHIMYHIYSLKERYATRNRLNDSISLPENYYDFRKNVDLNADKIRDFYPYSNYIHTLVDNITYKNHKCNQTLDAYTTKLRVIDSLISNETLKNSLLQNIGNSYFNKKDNAKNRATFLRALKNRTNDKALVSVFTKLSTNLNKLSIGTPFPDFKVITPNHKIVFVQDLITKPTVLYFWTQKYPRHLKNVQKKVLAYNQKSKYNFIGICIDDSNENWIKIAKKFNLNDNYSIVNSIDVEQKLMLSAIHKIFIVDKNGTIISNNLNLFDVQFELKLKKL